MSEDPPTVVEPPEGPHVGWHDDPDHSLQPLYWDGETWSRGAPAVRRPSRREPPSNRRVNAWYVLSCLLPFGLSLALPFIVWQSASARMSASQLDDLVLGLLCAGWLPYLIGLVGRTVTSSVFDASPASEPWRTPTLVLAWVVGVWGVVASFFLMIIPLIAIVGGAGNAGL